MHKFKLKSSGFTLVELLIVMLVIGVLAAIAIPKFTTMKEKSFIATITSDLKNLSSQQEIYHSRAYAYAPTVATLGLTLSPKVTVAINEATGTGWAATAAHTGLVGRNCGMFFGDAAATGADPATTPGAVVCD